LLGLSSWPVFEVSYDWPVGAEYPRRIGLLAAALLHFPYVRRTAG
jgi:hypothetical protein